MSAASNLPDDFSWAAFDRYWGEPEEEDEKDVMEDPCPSCGAAGPCAADCADRLAEKETK